MENLVVMVLVLLVLESIAYYSWKCVDILIVKKYKKKESAIENISNVEIYESKLVGKEIKERKWTKFIFSLISLWMAIVSWKLSSEILLRYDTLGWLSELLNKL